MNILISTNMFPPIATGSSHYAQDLAKSFSEDGHKVVVVTSKLKGYDYSHEDSLPYKVVRLPCIHFSIKGLFKWFTVVTFNPFNYFRLAKIIKNFKIDVIHQVNHYLDSAVLTRIVSPFTSTPVACSIHTQLTFKSKLIAPLARYIDRMLCGRFILGHASKIVALDTEIVRYLAETHGNKWLENRFAIIPHAIELNEETFPRKRDYSSKMLIVSVGHVIDQRNRVTLIRAMKLITNQIPDAHLEIIGHVYIPEPLELVKELGLESNVTFRGEMSHEDTLTRLIEADCHAVWLNTRYRGTGTAVSESMLCGVPVVNNSPEGLLGENTLIHMENIVLINEQKPDDIAQKVISLMKDQSLRESIAKNGRRFITERMNLNIVRDDLIDLYQSITPVSNKN